ncbi:DUF3857 domain-containing transglutaminase family protein [Ruegeria atlantica]|uniref:DUF3857 domain-containing transglutaminase family protein n=1 Tax=Ruegeria atlantica TaxID=81569 RepID=UPI00147F20C2
MNALFPDISAAPVKTPIFNVETELNGAVRAELRQLEARKQFALNMLFALALSVWAAIFLAESVGTFFISWHSNLGLSAAGEQPWTALFVGLLCLFFARSSALKAGSFWAIWTGRAPVILTPTERVPEAVTYSIEQDHVTAQEKDFTESWHFAHISRLERNGRFVMWRSPDMRLLFFPLPTEQDAQHLLRKLKQESRSGKGSFALQDAPDAALVQNISARDAFEALEGVAKKTGTKCPDRLDSVFNYLTFLILTGFAALGLWSLVSGDTVQAGFPLFNQLCIVLLVTALMAHASFFRKHLPRLRHLHFARYGLVRGIAWGPTAVTCDTSGLEIWREGRVLRIGWNMVRAVHCENYLTVVELTDDQVFVIPEIPSATNLFAAHRTSRGLGPWDGARHATVPKQGKKKRWWSFLISGVVWLIVFVTILGFIGWLQSKPAAAEMLRNPTLPAWYEEVSPQDRGAALAADRSVSQPLFDEKMRVEEAGYEIVRQGFFVVHDRSSLEDFGEVRLTVDPIFERATLHRLRIHRNGKTFDQLDLPFRELSLERELKSGVMQGDIEYFGQIADLRVGDGLEIIWSKKVTTPVFPDQFHYWADKPRVSSWTERRISIDLPASTRFGLNHTEDFSINRYEANGRTVLSWAFGEIEEEDRNLHAAEAWDVSNDGMQLSTFLDWGQIAQRFATDYRPRPDLLPDDLIAILEEIAAQSDDPEWRATQALRLVQDRVRYFSVSIGEGGWIPRTPNTVWSTAYGDCKDKALLLISMLAHLGIQADAVIVDHEIGPALPRMLPSPFVFDHAIVRIRDVQGDWFVDPTDLLQGGVGRAISLTDFTWGLPLSPDSTELVEIVRHLPAEPTSEVLQEYTLLDEGPVAAILDVTETWRGVNADYRRWLFDRQDEEKRHKNYEDWYADRFPGATHPDAMVVEDDLDANVIRLVQRYSLPRDGFEEDGLWADLSHFGYVVSDQLYELDDDAALAGQSQVNNPIHAVHRVVMRNVPASLNQPVSYSFENRFVDFETKGEWNEAEASLRYEWVLKTKKTTLKPGDEDAWREAADYVEDHDIYNVNLHQNLFGRVVDKPAYLGMNAIQLMVLPLLVLVAMMMFLMFRSGVRAEVAASRAMMVSDRR